MLMQESRIIESKHNTMLATDSNKKNETTTTTTKIKNQKNDFKET